MADKSPADKMRFKPTMSVALLHVPAEVQAGLGIPADTTVAADPAAADFVLVAASTQAEAEERLRALAPHVQEKTLAWLAYPKGSKAAGRDVSRDTIWRFAGTVGLAVVANVAIDAVWSAVRLKPGG